MPGKSHGRRSLVGCSRWGREEWDTTQQLHFHFSLSCIGEGNGNPLQCSCLENPRDGEAWCAAVYGVAQSRTRLTRLSSSSSLVNGQLAYLVENSVSKFLPYRLEIYCKIQKVLLCLYSQFFFVFTKAVTLNLAPMGYKPC